MQKYVTDINNKIYIEKSIIREKKLENNLENVIKVTNNKINDFYGFGSAITESSGYNYSKLSNENKKNFISDYYSNDGLNFNFGRVSIGSNDFSLKSFSYAKKRDLSDFSINKDKEYVIPMLKDILKYKKISLIASPWSPPRMFKRLPILRWGIKLSKRYYDKYSDYLVKYLEEYNKLGINIDYITIQNEPMARQRFESCVFKNIEQKEFIYKYLLPKLDKTKLLLWDHNKDNLFKIVNYLYEDNKKIAGTCFHYYTGHLFNELKKIHEKYPNMLLINSEMCCGYSEYNEIKWIKDAEYYLRDIIGDMNSGINAYLDWNILLDTKGGPTHSKNYVKSPSIRDSDNYIKSPIYYYLYHISHFIGKKTIVVETKSSNELKIVSLISNNKLTIIIMNDTDKKIDFNIVFSNKYIQDKISSHSIITYQE